MLASENAWAQLEVECSKAVPNVEKVRDLCREHGVPPAIRTRVWQVLLGVVNRKANLDTWWADEIEIEDLQVVKADVIRTRQNIPKFKDAAVQKEMEKLLLIYCKRRSVKYTQGLNELLAPFIDLRADTPAPNPPPHPYDRNEIFNAFYALVYKFLPNTLRGHDLKSLRRSLQLVRILLRYHYPRVATILDAAGIGPDFYATSWLATLFASTNEMPIVHMLWDQATPYIDRYCLTCMYM
jgi:CRISPR/Cas system CSM-associated protein Csm2 small subunit